MRNVNEKNIREYLPIARKMSVLLLKSVRSPQKRRLLNSVSVFLLQAGSRMEPSSKRADTAPDHYQSARPRMLSFELTLRAYRSIYSSYSRSSLSWCEFKMSTLNDFK